MEATKKGAFRNVNDYLRQCWKQNKKTKEWYQGIQNRNFAKLDNRDVIRITLE